MSLKQKLLTILIITSTLTLSSCDFLIDLLIDEEDEECPEGYKPLLCDEFEPSYGTVNVKVTTSGADGTSNKDINYVNCSIANTIFDIQRDCDALRARNDSGAEPGDWSRIEVSSGGQLEAENVKFIYGGQPYFLGDDFGFGGQFPSRIINNLGGEVVLSQSSFTNSHIHGEDDEKPGQGVVPLTCREVSSHQGHDPSK